jgi:hypothetical protein
MATVPQFKHPFDGRYKCIMYKALDLACAQLGAAGHSHSTRKVIAQQIIAAMEKGERDSARLCTLGLAALERETTPTKQAFAIAVQEQSPFPQLEPVGTEVARNLRNKTLRRGWDPIQGRRA